MAKSLRTFLEDMRRAYPSEVVTIAKRVNPLTYDVTAIVKQLGRAAGQLDQQMFAQRLHDRT